MQAIDHALRLIDMRDRRARAQKRRHVKRLIANSQKTRNHTLATTWDLRHSPANLAGRHERRAREPHLGLGFGPYPRVSLPHRYWWSDRMLRGRGASPSGRERRFQLAIVSRTREAQMSRGILRIDAVR